jgi:hypothetical protein
MFNEYSSTRYILNHITSRVLIYQKYYKVLLEVDLSIKFVI